MRVALATTVLAAAIAVSTTPAAAASPPTQRQIARAVAAAESSKSLWATINICNSRADPYNVGVRGQMPSLGFRASMSMTVRLQSYNPATKRFVAIDSPYAINQRTLGSFSTGLQQWGAVFPFATGQTGRWNAVVTFTWKRNGKVLGQVQRTTTAGHPSADDGSPPRYSAASCTIKS